MKSQTTHMIQDLSGQTVRLWSYPNPFKAPGKELSDVIADNHVFLFFDQFHGAFERRPVDVELSWERWRKEAIDKQIKTAHSAVKHIQLYRRSIFIDAKAQVPLPVSIPTGTINIHSIIVAHGAADACKAFSADNVSGSLGITYADQGKNTRYTRTVQLPFIVNLDRSEIVHVFDSRTLELVLGELDTFCDFSSYIEAKEAAIRKYDLLMYAGEEDLLAYYFLNFNEETRQHMIGPQERDYDALMVEEGGWVNFFKSELYRAKKLADRVSYMWDSLLQRTTQNALDGKLFGDGGIFSGNSAVYEMAKEPRFSRRGLCHGMREAITNFPDARGGEAIRNLTFMPSYFQDTAYVFLQVHFPDGLSYEGEKRNIRFALLKIACGVAKIKHPLDSGAKCNGVKRSGFERPCQARRARPGMAS